MLDDSGEDDRAARGNGLQLAPSRPAAPKPRDDDGVGGDSGAAPAVDTRRLWVDKHTPTTSEQLAVAPKKVAEVRGWLQFACAPHSVNRALLLTGMRLCRAPRHPAPPARLPPPRTLSVARVRRAGTLLRERRAAWMRQECHHACTGR